MSNQLRVPLRIIFYKDDRSWIAHCLEFDLIGDGPSRQVALDSLHEAIRLQVEWSIENDDLDNLFHPALSEYQRMFAGGRELVPNGP